MSTRKPPPAGHQEPPATTDLTKSSLKSQVRFAMVPEWLIYADVSHGAVRLYAVLDRHANRENIAWPSRATLGRLMGCSTDTVDRYITELRAVKALTVRRRSQHSKDGKKIYRTNLYELKQIRRGVAAPMRPGGRTAADRGSRTNAEQNETTIEPEPLSRKESAKRARQARKRVV